MKPLILAISTSSSACDVALLLPDGVFHTQHELTPNQHTRLVLPMIDQLLQSTGITKKDITAIAVDVGPGSFTGIRIGLGVAQGLSLGLSLPIYPITSMDALAHAAFAANHPSVLCAIDARMHEVFFTVYQNKSDFPAEAPQCISRDALPAWQERYPTACCVGSGWFDETLTLVHPSAIACARLALLQIQSGNPGESAFAVQPCYLRNEVAKLPTP